MFKKRKLISIMLTVSMMLTLFPFAAFAEEGGQAGAEQTQQEPAQPAEVATELPTAGEDGVITLNKDVELSATHEFTKDTTLNLNGHNITAKDKRALWVKAGTLTIEGQGTITSVKQEDGKLEDSSSVIRVGDRGDAAKLVLGEGVIVEAPATYGVTVFGTNSSLEAAINGSIHSVSVPALAGNGSSNLAATTITLGNTANVTADKTVAIFHPQAGTLNVNGATVQGTGGIEMKSGTLNVADGSKITATANETKHETNGNGTSTDGYAIAAVDNSAYKGKVDINVAGGQITGPVNKVVDNQVDEGKAGNISISGGSFSVKPDASLLEPGFAVIEGADGSISVGVSADSEATWTENGVKKAGTLDAAIKALKDQGGTIVVLKDATITDAKYVINNKITLQKSASATTAPKIDVTVATGETTIAFNLQQNADLTLDGVAMTVKGTKNADTAKKNDGTAFNVNHSNSDTTPGANLTLQNGAVLTVTDLERGLIFSGKDVKTQATVNVNPGTTMNIINIDGNASNGGEWAVDKAILNVKNCGELGLSAQKIVAKNGATINVDGAGKTGVVAKDLTLKNGSDLNVTNCGAKLPFDSKWSPDETSYKNAVEIKKDGNVTLSGASEINLTNNKNKDGKDINNVYLPKGDVSASQNSSVNGNIVNGEPDQGDYRVEYIVNGEVYYSVTVTAENGKVSYTAPKNPSRSGYTFEGWDYNGVKVDVATDNKASFKPVDGKKVYIFDAEFSKNSSTPAVTEYSVTVKKTDNGSVSVSPKCAEAGDKVTITVDPDKGYVVDAVAVTDKDGDKITVTKKTATKYTFTMPKSRVDVKVTFKAEQTEPEQPSEMPFVDVVKDAWYYPAVEYVYNNELMNGTNGGLTFEPNVNLNRAMMAAVLYNMEGKPACDKSGIFSDVADGMWYTDAVNWAASNNIVSGMPDGTYAPDQALTREQMASILYRYAEYKGIDVSARADLSTFTDGTTVSPWAQDVVQWAVAEKLMSGNGTELQPKGTASRAQVATVLMNYCENVAK